MLEMSIVHVLPSAADNYDGKAFHARGPGNREIFITEANYVRVERRPKLSAASVVLCEVS